MQLGWRHLAHAGSDLSVGGRKQNLDRCANADFGFDRDLAAGLGDYSVHGGEAKAGSPIRTLGAVEGFETVALRILQLEERAL
jgi:hypothetical protein